MKLLVGNGVSCLLHGGDDDDDPACFVVWLMMMYGVRRCMMCDV